MPAPKFVHSLNVPSASSGAVVLKTIMWWLPGVMCEVTRWTPEDSATGSDV